MPKDDWLVGGDRRVAAAERIYAAAADLIARDGPDAFDIDALAARVHCSRATIYRHTGGKAEIRDAVLTRAAETIIDTVRRSVEGLSGSARILAAVTVALERIRADPLGQLMIGALRSGQSMGWLTDSAVVAGLAADINGLSEDDAPAAGWIVRVVLAMLYWPFEDAEMERDVLMRFVSPAFDQRRLDS